MTTPEEITRIEQEIVLTLKNIYDPEIPVNIYDLGLRNRCRAGWRSQYSHDTDCPQLSHGRSTPRRGSRQRWQDQRSYRSQRNPHLRTALGQKHDF